MTGIPSPQEPVMLDPVRQEVITGTHTVVVSADGFCVVPEWQTGRTPLGSRTLVCPFWVRLDLGPGSRQRDILLIADQLRPDEWRRLRALLARARGE